MVPQLADVVENSVLSHRGRVIRALDDLFHGLAVPLSACNQLVAVIDIRFVVQVVVIFERFLGHAFAGKRVMCIGKIGKFESHVSPLVGAANYTALPDARARQRQGLALHRRQEMTNR